MAPKKIHSKTHDEFGFNSAEYFAIRNKRLVSFIPEEMEVKQKIKDAAKSDGRNVNSWILHHVLPIMEKLADEQLKKKPLTKPARKPLEE